ncbi:hypothetical protein [Acidovorax sp.]|uniref:hypothetical protein n=1 Tax=Acidovorax sp. TaxID=1872122 RepID=UPI0031E1EE0A
MSEKQSKKSTGRGGKREGAGRPAGSLDKGNALIREMIVEALDQAGGVEYLVRQANAKPAAFLALIGKVMPVQIEADVNANVNGSISVQFVKP